MKKIRLMELAGLSHLMKEALNKSLVDFGKDAKKFLESKNLEVRLGEGDVKPYFEAIEDNAAYAGLVLGNQQTDLYIIVNDSKEKVLEDLIKKFKLEQVEDQKSSGSWDSADSAGTKKTHSEGELYIAEAGRKGKTFQLLVRGFKASDFSKSYLNK